ncbi:MAG TPA: capsule assembly Wzi family protein, partial [Povalibacter sp.]|nr:capsule assembly Wzi family protein [Povalibacter sp.]
MNSLGHLFRSLVIASMLGPAHSTADPWLAPGDEIMRHDVELLADAGVLKGPTTQWPLPWPDIARDLNAFGTQVALTRGEQAALNRLQRAANLNMRTSELRAHIRVSGANDPDQLRGFSDLPREKGELEGGVDWTGTSLAVRAQATAVSDPKDGQTWRADGSYVAATLWNMMLSAGYMDRWWGPG